jgi:glutathione synthase/RimK-type ligase-like ATP-grasp enzyme
MLNKTVLVLGAGGPASTNVIDCFHLAGGFRVVGADADEVMLELSHADMNHKVHHSVSCEYFEDVKALVEKYDVNLVYPQTDKEIITCALHRDQIPKLCLPSTGTVAVCRDKGEFYKFLATHNLPCPAFQLVGDEWGFDDDFKHGELINPFWVRARVGAGGYMAYQCYNESDFQNILRYQNEHFNLKWMKVEYLQGRDYCWTSLWRKGELLTSVLKERVRWVYGRIGTTAVQKTVRSPMINELCERVLRVLDDGLTGLMMVDLKANVYGTPYITEVNAGRVGTVNKWFAQASLKIYGDHRVNFPYLLWLIHNDLELPSLLKFDALPEGVWYYRHIDMGDKLVLPKW